MAYHLKHLSAEDAEAFRALRLEALRQCPVAFSASYAEEARQSARQVAARLRRDPVFGAWVDGQLCGAAGFAVPPLDKKRHKGTLWGVYVRPGIRREGLGTALVEAVVAHARGRVLQLHAAVVTDNQPARRLYLKLGFRPYGIEPRGLMVDGRAYDQELLVLHLDR